MPRVKIDDDTKTILDEVVEQSDEYSWNSDALSDIAAALDDIDMREYPEYDNPVQVLIDGAHASKAGIQPADYDPEPELDGWLDSDTVRRITSAPGAVINPAHVGSKSKPRDRVDRRKLIASMVRYRFDVVHASQVKDVVTRTFGESSDMQEYVSAVCEHEFWEDPNRDGWFIVDASRAAVSTRAFVDECRRRLRDELGIEDGRIGDVASIGCVAGWTLKHVRETEERVAKLDGHDGEHVEETIKLWNGFVEELREAGVEGEVLRYLVTY